MDILKNSTAFAPTATFSKGGRQTLAATSFSEKTIYYSLAEGTPDELKLALSRYLAFCGTSKETKTSLWKTWVTTWCCIITPSFAGQLPADSFRKIEVNSQTMTTLLGIMGRLDTAHETEVRADVDNVGNEIKAFNGIPNLPTIGEDVDFGLGGGEWIGKVALCYYALVLFMAGKRIESSGEQGKGHEQITTNRPKALRGKAHIDMALDFLEGGLRMSNDAHVAIGNAWSEMGQLRAIVFTEYAGYDSETADAAKDIIWTTVHLLKFANMSHAVITYNFLTAYPWAAELPVLKTAISIYLGSVKNASKIDPRMFPYIKLIYGDKSGLFPRKEMEPLIACATATLSQTNASLSDFYTSAAFNPIVDAFLTERDRRENIRSMKIQKSEQELLDFMEPDEPVMVNPVEAASGNEVTE